MSETMRRDVPNDVAPNASVSDGQERRAGSVFAVPVGHLRANPKNPRRDLGDVTELAQSIAEHGILQPLIAIRQSDSALMLLAGHRRLAAARVARLSVVPVLIVGDKLPDDQLTLAVIENLHHAPLSPLDEARACKALLDHGRSRKDIAFDLARSGNWVADRLALLELPRELQKRVETGDLPIGKAADMGKKLAKHGSASIVTGARAGWHFTKMHDLAPGAVDRCNTANHPMPGRIGPACGACWEAVIRHDERTSSPVAEREPAHREKEIA